MKEFTRTEWNKTPYSGTTAKDTIRDIDRLFQRYRITTHQIINAPGPNGRPGFAVNFTSMICSWNTAGNRSSLSCSRSDHAHPQPE